MQSQSKKSLLDNNRIAYLAAHSLFLTYTEALLPKITPFFRLGLGNVVILLALDLDIKSFLVLALIKTVAASMMNGTLFSPFFLISIAQSLGSGLLMYGLNKVKGKWLSVYGISLSGSALSALIQISLCALYLKAGVFKLLGPMLLFSVFSGIVTATLSITLKIKNEPPALEIPEDSENKKETPKAKVIAMLISIVIASVLIFMINNLYVLGPVLVISFAAQILCKRKIKVLPHISMWIFVIISCLFVPEGKVLLSMGNLSITLGALLKGISKSLKLSSVMALSQCMASIRIYNNSIIGLTLRYFDQIKIENKKSKKAD